MAEFLAVVWLNAKTSRKDILSIQRLQFDGVTLERYMNEKSCASFIASQIHTFFVCNTESGANLLIARLSADDMHSVAEAVLNACTGEAAIQVTEVLRSGEKKEQVYVGYRNVTGKTEFKETTMNAEHLMTPVLSVPSTASDPENLNVGGIMAPVLAAIGTALIAEAMKPESTSDSLLEKGTDMVKASIPKIQEAIEAGIPMAKGASEVIAKSVESLADHGKVAAAQVISKAVTAGVPAAKKAASKAGSVVTSGAAAVVPKLAAIPYAGWIIAGITVAAIAITCTCCAISKAIPIPRKIEKDIKDVGKAIGNYALNPYPLMVYQLAYASGPEWKKQLDAVASTGTAYVDCCISDREEAIAIIVRVKAIEAWEDSFPGWFLMNTQSMMLELSSGEKVPLGIVSSNKEFSDFLKLRMPPLSNERYAGLIEKFAKQF